MFVGFVSLLIIFLYIIMLLIIFLYYVIIRLIASDPSSYIAKMCMYEIKHGDIR